MRDHYIGQKKRIEICVASQLAAIDGKDVPNYLFELIRDYFKDRVLMYDTDDCRKSYVISTRIAQGSVLGPIL